MDFLNSVDKKRIEKFISSAGNDMVAFVGSGISHASPTNLPLWNEVVNELILRVRRTRPNNLSELEQVEATIRVVGDPNVYLSGIERLKKLLGEDIFTRCVQEQLESEGKGFPPVLYELLLCDLKGIITTNLDTLIEDTYAEALHNRDLKGKQEIVLSNDYSSAAQLSLKRNWLWKLHGTLSNPDTWVMTIADYYAGINNERHIANLVNIFQNSRILFMGYSANDIDFVYILKKLHSQFGSRAKGHILLARNANDFDLAMLDSYSIDVIEYGGDDSHENLRKIISTIKKKAIQ